MTVIQLFLVITKIMFCIYIDFKIILVKFRFQTSEKKMRAWLKLLPEDRDAEVVSRSDVRSFDIVTEQYQGNEQVVDVGFVNREEDHGHILLEKQDTDEHEYMKTI